MALCRRARFRNETPGADAVRHPRRGGGGRWSDLATGALPRSRALNQTNGRSPMTIRRRAVLTATAGLAIAGTARAARPEPAVLTPELIAAAKKEGKIAWYTSDDLVLATHASKAFEAKYGMTVQLERSGAERIYQRIAQEYSSNINAVDVATTSDLGHTVSWNASGWLDSFVPAEAANWTGKAIGPDGIYIVDKFTMVISGYNSR